MSSTRTNNSAHAKTRTDDKFEKTGIEALRANGMMAHLLQSLEAKQDIGHYGRLVFAMIARHFLNEDELLSKLCMNPGFDEMRAKALANVSEDEPAAEAEPECIVYMAAPNVQPLPGDARFRLEETMPSTITSMSYSRGPRRGNDRADGDRAKRSSQIVVGGRGGIVKDAVKCRWPRFCISRWRERNRCQRQFETDPPNL